MRDTYTVEIVDRIDRVNQEEWDALCKERPFASHRCLDLSEKIYAHHEARYLLLRSNGRLEAGAICALQRSFHLSAYVSNRMLQNFVARLLARFPPLNCAIPIVFESGLLVRPGGDSARVIPALLDEMDDLAARERVSFVGLVNLGPHHTAWPALSRAGYHSVGLPSDTYLEINWTDFEDYQADLPHKKRSEFRRVRRRAGDAGVTVETVRPSPEIEPRLRQLVCNVHQRHNLADPYTPDLFLNIADVMAEDLSLLVARQGGDMIACLALLRSGGELAIKFPGLDYERTLDTFTYHLIMTESVAKAIDLGVRRLRLGATAYRLKKLMGATVEDRFLALNVRGRLLHRLVGWGLTLSGRQAMPDF